MNNLTQISAVSVYTEYHSSLLAWVVLVLLINFLGAAANDVTFAATRTYRPLRKSSSCFLLAHCIIDGLIASLLIEPGVVLKIYMDGGSLRPGLCRSCGSFVYLTFFANNWAHGLLACNRFIAAIFPYRYKFFTAKIILTLSILFPWLFPLMFNEFPIAEIKTRYLMPKAWTTCLL
ncbi:hypothetical protein BV898_03136 [Hypsibius exemplaris]|uniref:G-protein coupled receptors family 1 profile domain-containing protein n=1 Tax=Hypsibius exemplaris TaxID=2072580 RepID=A0A1W0X766_HYPEX|nr:hypothetical protein BV898_03136 [Hypsibius exemplaris]